MAKIDFDFPDDVLGNLLESDFTEIAEESLDKAAPELLESVKKSCDSVIKDKSRKELVDSFKTWKGGVIKARTGAYMLGVAAYGKPSEKSKWTSHPGTGKTRIRNTTNNDIAWWLEHGNAHQPAKPFIDRATKDIQNKVLKICQEVFDRKVKR